MRLPPTAAGALAGLATAAAQTLVSRAVAPRLPLAMQPPDFVPDAVVRWAAARFPPLSDLPSDLRGRLALGLHLGYGSALGVLYAGIAGRPALPAPASGACFGLVAWAVGFQGWIPALGILPRTTARPPAQWIAPILGHLLFGAVTAVILQVLGPRRVACAGRL